MGCSASVDSAATAKKLQGAPQHELTPALCELLPRYVCGPDAAECTICSNSMAQEVTVVLPCFHTYHLECGIAWLQRDATCPVCRLRVTAETLDPLRPAAPRASTPTKCHQRSHRGGLIQ